MKIQGPRGTMGHLIKISNEPHETASKSLISAFYDRSIVRLYMFEARGGAHRGDQNKQDPEDRDR